MKRSDDYQNEEFNEESDDYVYIDEDDNAKSAGGSGVVVVLGVIAAVCAVALAAVIGASFVFPKLFTPATETPDGHRRNRGHRGAYHSAGKQPL